MPFDTWGMKLVGYVIGDDQLIRIENIKMIYEKSPNDKDLEKVRYKMDSCFMWNMSVAMVGTIGLVHGLQRLLPAYRKSIGVGTFIIDLGIFSLAAGLSFLYSLSQLQPQLLTIRKKWINSHNLDYLKKMNYMHTNYGIPLFQQVKPYVPVKELELWKSKYDQTLRLL